MTRGQLAGEVIIGIGLTRDEAEHVWSPTTPPSHRVLCNPDAQVLRADEAAPRLSLVRCDSELPFLSHCADEVVLSARLLPNAVLIAEARRVLAPQGMIWVTPSIFGRWDEGEQALVASELEAAGLTVEQDPTADWNGHRVIFAHVARGRRQ